ncbi:hypothetical protein QQF64_033291 [Cirrhinus molitorella]|uniref:Uncharacterized protein n=1 Tax=Cirrhinus molitorella TaxID=172907 RepID=A0ABR3MTG9_9TELE
MGSSAERRCWTAEARVEGAAAVSQSAWSRRRWNCPVLMLFKRSRLRGGRPNLLTGEKVCLDKIIHDGGCG